MTQENLIWKKEIILKQELAFANEIGKALFEKPKVSVWMIFIPFLFLYFIFRMQKFKKDRIQFSTEFMSARRDAMEAALDSLEPNREMETNPKNQYEKLPVPLQKPYQSWIKTLSAFYHNLLSSDGDGFEILVRRAYRNKRSYEEALDRLNRAEKEFYTALKPLMVKVEGAAAVIGKIESESRRLRTESATSIFS